MDEVSSNQHSSAYSSLANSTTEIHDIVKMEGESGKVSRNNNKRTAVDLQMRAITEDYNALLRRATEQIRDDIQCVFLEVFLVFPGAILDNLITMFFVLKDHANRKCNLGEGKIPENVSNLPQSANG